MRGSGGGRGGARRRLLRVPSASPRRPAPRRREAARALRTEFRTSGCGGFLLQETFHLSWLGETPELLLREDELVVRLDLEDPSVALDELRPGPELLLDLLRQTGGARVVVSGRAVLDADA
jgi:hypothetical protein